MPKEGNMKKLIKRKKAPEAETVQLSEKHYVIYGVPREIPPAWCWSIITSGTHRRRERACEGFARGSRPRRRVASKSVAADGLDCRTTVLTPNISRRRGCVDEAVTVEGCGRRVGGPFYCPSAKVSGSLAIFAAIRRA